MNALKQALRSDLCRFLVPFLLFLTGEPGAPATGKPETPTKYQKFFFHFADRRSFSEQALNAIGLTSAEVGRSFALIAGVDTYSNLPPKERSLPAAAIDIQKLKIYLRDVESFDEIVVLQNEAVTDDNLKFFLQAYFPPRLHAFPNSRFLFAYSGHGIQDGTRGYLIQANASSFYDKANTISLEVLRTMYQEIVDSAYQSIALINACHGGFFTRASFGQRRRLLPRGPGAHAITAGGSHERSWSDGRPGRGSIFFEKLFAGLEGRADLLPEQTKSRPGDGIITEQELYTYLLQEVQLETDQRQNPQESDLLRDGSIGSFFFLNRARTITAEPIKPRNPNQEGPRRSMGDQTPSGNLPPGKQEELALDQKTKEKEWPENLAEDQTDTSAGKHSPREEEERIIGLWSNDNPRVIGGLLEIKENPRAPGFIAIQSSDNNETSYKGEVVLEFAFDIGQRKFVGRHLWGGGKTDKQWWGNTGALTIEVKGPDSIKVFFLDSIYKDGWTYTRVTRDR